MGATVHGARTLEVSVCLCTRVHGHARTQTCEHTRAHKHTCVQWDKAPDFSRGLSPANSCSFPPSPGWMSRIWGRMGGCRAQDPGALPTLSGAAGSLPPAQGSHWVLRAASPLPRAHTGHCGQLLSCLELWPTWLVMGRPQSAARCQLSQAVAKRDYGSVETLLEDGVLLQPWWPMSPPPVPPGLYFTCPDLPSSPISCPRLVSLSIHRLTLYVFTIETSIVMFFMVPCERTTGGFHFPHTLCGHVLWWHFRHGHLIFAPVPPSLCSPCRDRVGRVVCIGPGPSSEPGYRA